MPDPLALRLLAAAPHLVHYLLHTLAVYDLRLRRAPDGAFEHTSPLGGETVRYDARFVARMVEARLLHAADDGAVGIAPAGELLDDALAAYPAPDAPPGWAPGAVLPRVRHR